MSLKKAGEYKSLAPNHRRLLLPRALPYSVRPMPLQHLRHLRVAVDALQQITTLGAFAPQMLAGAAPARHHRRLEIQGRQGEPLAYNCVAN